MQMRICGYSKEAPEIIKNNTNSKEIEQNILIPLITIYPINIYHSMKYIQWERQVIDVEQMRVYVNIPTKPKTMKFEQNMPEILLSVYLHKILSY